MECVVVELNGPRVPIGILSAMMSPTAEQNGSTYGVIIDTPKWGQSVSVVDVTGTFKKRLPPTDKYTLMILRHYPASENGFIPLQKVDHIDHAKKKWSASKCDIGGGTGEKRALGVYLVGPSGRALFRYFREAAAEHNVAKKRLEKYPDEKPKNLPLIFEGTRDMIKCAEVFLIRE